MKHRRLLRWLSDIFILSAALILVGLALFGAQTALAARTLAQEHFLRSTIAFELPLPTFEPQVEPMVAPETKLDLFLPLAQSSISTTEQALIVPFEAFTTTLEAPTIPPDEAASVLQSPVPTQTLSSPMPSPPPEPTPAPSAGPVVRLVIPSIKVDRAVVPVDLRRGSSGQLEWNTEKLFSTRNRPDLVGQLAVSTNPGDGSNIVLLGHNYNEGGVFWEGVFVNLKSVKVGDHIIVYTQNGGEFTYQVRLVKKVPWREQNSKELEKHQKYIWPTEQEQLTLITCGGANIWPFPARIYVIAEPLSPGAP